MHKYSKHHPTPPIYHVFFLLACMMLPLISMGLMGEQILRYQVYSFEQPLMLAIHARSGSLITHLSLVLHWLGTWYIATVYLILWSFYEYRRHHLGRALFIVLSGALPVAVMSAAKFVFQRPRPQLWPHLVNEHSASFPSGHSTFAAAFALTWMILYWHSKARWGIVFCALLLMFAMGCSRLVLGVHYPSDVLAGWLTGLGVVSGVYLMMRKSLSYRQDSLFHSQ